MKPSLKCTSKKNTNKYIKLFHSISSLFFRVFVLKMVIYIEACESGSMLENLLPNNINVYATTASNAEESSYACYYDSKRNTYLGDVYSVVWMEDSDAEKIDQESLFQQYSITQQKTNTSHVMQYGDLVRRTRKTYFLWKSNVLFSYRIWVKLIMLVNFKVQQKKSFNLKRN